MELSLSPKIELQLLIIKAKVIQNRLYSWNQNTQRFKDKIKTTIDFESRLWGEIVDYFVEDLNPKYDLNILNHKYNRLIRGFFAKISYLLRF